MCTLVSVAMPPMVDTGSSVDGLAARDHTRNVTALYVLHEGE